MQHWHLTTEIAYLTSGIGYGRKKLSAFEAAELDANIGAANAARLLCRLFWRLSDAFGM